jgi:hypothetical protein
MAEKHTFADMINHFVKTCKETYPDKGEIPLSDLQFQTCVPCAFCIPFEYLLGRCVMKEYGIAVVLFVSSRYHGCSSLCPVAGWKVQCDGEKSQSKSGRLHKKEKEIRDIQEKIYAKNPQNCWW